MRSLTQLCLHRFPISPCLKAAYAAAAASLLLLGSPLAAEENSQAPLISQLVDPAGDRRKLTLHDRSDVREFYESRGFAAAWTAESSSSTAIAILRDSAGDGLNPAIFGLAAISAHKDAGSAREAAQFDVLLTDAMLTYIRQMGGSRVNPSRISTFVAMPSSIDSAADILARSLADGSLQSLPDKVAPPHEEYRRLKESLARYRQKRGGSSRTEQIIANMERWRWLPHPFEDTYIEVNSADSTLQAVKNGEVVLSSRLVTGRPSTPTPLFRTTVTGVTINPSWDVPGDIAVREMLPKEGRHPGYLQSHNFVADRPGGALRQLPGAHNALGRILVEMPNIYDVYLHDTPGQNLFDKPDRHLSHGCMRVEHLRALVSFILAGDVESSLGDVRSAIDNGETQSLPLSVPIPVYILYWTAVPNADGSVAFHRDVYGWDAALLAALHGHRNGGHIS